MDNRASSLPMTMRHRGRAGQVRIYLGKLLRMFIYQSDWKVLPMAALIAGLVGMVVRKRFFLNMEGTLMGAFAFVCVCIWNGCFNSIQVICRERAVIKREHRSGMHITSYVASHMLYQALLCLLQTGITLYVSRLAGVQYPDKGLLTPWLMVDLGISMFLITYASDILSLWVSALAHNTTTAMTIMPFVLIFQLVFSGGMLSLPAWTEPLTHFTISNYGLKVICAQADYNALPLVTPWNTLMKMKDDEVSATITLGQALEALSRDDVPAIARLRDTQLDATLTVSQARDLLVSLGSAGQAQESGDLALALEALKAMDLSDVGDQTIGGAITVGALIDQVAESESVQAHLDDSFTFTTTINDLLQLVGEESAKEALQQRSAAASFNADYANTPGNIAKNWIPLLLSILAYALLTTITLEFIDKDKR